jgi:hypothetical protein
LRKKTIAALIIIALLTTLFISAYALTMNPKSYTEIVLTYDNGDVEVFDAKPSLFSFLNPNSNYVKMVDTDALRIIDYNLNREISSITVNFYVTPTFLGTVTGYTISSSIEGRLYDAGTNAYLAKLWGPTSVPFSGGAISSGQAVRVMSSTISESSLQGMYGNWVNAKQYYYTVWCPSDITMTLTFSDGHSESLPTMPTRMAYRFTYFDPRPLP